MKNTKRINKERIIFIILLFLILDLFFPLRFSRISLKLGDIAKYDVVAPFSFPVLKDRETLEKERTSAALSIAPVLRKVDVSEENIKLLKRISRKYPFLKKPVLYVWEKGIVFDKSSLPESKNSQYEIISSRGSSIVPINKFFSYNEAVNYIKAKCMQRYRDTLICSKVIKEVEPLLQPNLLLDITETQKRREAARNRVPEEIGYVKKGEIIIRSHDIVDEETLQKLHSLQYAENNLYRIQRFRLFFRAQMLLLLLSIVLVLLIDELWKNTYPLSKKRNVVLLLTFIFLLFFRFVRFIDLAYLFPLAAASMVLSMEGGISTGIVYSVFLMGAIYIYNPVENVYTIPLLISGIYGAVLSRKLRSMNDLIKMGIFISILTMFFTLGNELLTGTKTLKLFYHIASALANGGISIVVLVGLLVLFERIFHISTNFTYLELSNLNHPLLRDLSIKAPGTYHHSIMVGNLGEAAAEAIGANDMLARVGGYFHDIGKMERPEYFIENQEGGFNPHDELPPKLSVAILKSHVSEGVELGKKHHLPEPIIKIILEHHGTSLIKPFFEKARDIYDTVQEEDFRYDGPVPSSKESAIIMLADSVEAAVKSVETSGEEEVRKVVEKIFEIKMKENQLDNAGLSITELKTIMDVFVKRLKAARHKRTSYPRVELK